MQRGGREFTQTNPAVKRTDSPCTSTVQGFTMVEMVMVVLFIGILAVIAVPRLSSAVISKYKAEVTAKKIVTDLRRVRSLAISNAANNTQGFSLKLTGPGPYNGYEIINLDNGTTIESNTIDPKVTVIGTSDEFQFGPLGNLTSSFTQITVSAEGKTFTITIIRATGTIKCVKS